MPHLAGRANPARICQGALVADAPADDQLRERLLAAAALPRHEVQEVARFSVERGWEVPGEAPPPPTGRRVAGRRVLLIMLAIVVFAAIPAVLLPMLWTHGKPPHLEDLGAVPAFKLI